MTGSLLSQSPVVSSNELVAPMEVVRQLARKTADRVAVLDRDFNVVYANESACADQPVAGDIPPNAMKPSLIGTSHVSLVRR